MIVTHIYHSAGIFTVTLTVSDGTDSDTDTTTVVIVKPNSPPGEPIITGPVSGRMMILYNYTIVSVDSDNDSLQYFVDWGDGSDYTSGFIGSNVSLVVNHSWALAGRYVVRVKAFDNETFSATSSYVVYIDCLEVDDIGYLIDVDSDGVYDRFHNSSSSLETTVKYRDNKYLLDVDGDNKWDYSFTESSGLIKYIESREAKETPGFEVTLLLLLILVFLWRRKRKPLLDRQC